MSEMLLIAERKYKEQFELPEEVGAELGRLDLGSKLLAELLGAEPLEEQRYSLRHFCCYFLLHS